MVRQNSVKPVGTTYGQLDPIQYFKYTLCGKNAGENVNVVPHRKWAIRRAVVLFRSFRREHGDWKGDVFEIQIHDGNNTFDRTHWTFILNFSLSLHDGV